MKKILPALAAVLVALAAFLVVVADELGDGDDTGRSVGTVQTLAPPATQPTVTVKVDGPAPGRAPDKTLEVPKVAVDQVASTDADDHGGLRSERPEGVSEGALAAARAQQQSLTDPALTISPLAAPQQTGCRSQFVANHSSRNGVRPRLFVLHYTVSPNRPGWSDVNGITAYFSRGSVQASSNYVIDAEGNCAYIVRETDKSWTQATFNPVSISVEIINTGKEPRLVGDGGLAKLGLVINDATKRWGIPLQTGKVSASCTVTRPGVIDHKALGRCGGGHHDISPYRPGPVLEAAKSRRRAGQVTNADRTTCRKLNAWRKAGRPRGGKWESNSVRRRRALDSRGVTCTSKGPVRR